MSHTDAELVEAAKNGDADSFARLYSRYYKDLYHFALSFLLREAEAEDAVCTAVTKAFEKLSSLKKNNSFKSWLYHITANECTEQLRHRTIYLNDNDYAEPSASETGFGDSEVSALLESLPERERLILTLSIFSGYNSREIASILNMKRGTVRSLKSRALETLRRQMQGETYD